ncbi:LamG domain-containing protein, partial [Flavobacterium sp. NRK F10]
LNFDGVNDYVNLGTSISTALNGATALTFEAWINPSVLNGWNNIITDYDGAYHKVLLRVRNNNNIQFVLNGTFLNSPFSVPLNTWTHIAAVYDGANMYVYANGTLIASQAASVSLPTTSNQFNIGNRISGSELFTGNIDEVRVWTTARTVEQING